MEFRRGNMPAERQIVLASSSPYRRALLARLGLPFTHHSPNIDEHPLPGEPPAGYVARLAQEKARTVPHTPGALVIGSDQAAADGTRLIGKPGTVAAAHAQLRAASGRTLRFFTAVAVLDTQDDAMDVEVVTVDVVFRTLSEAQIRAYVARERPLDCAGAFKCEGLGIGLFERIDSNDPTALVGLPLIALTRLLAARGLDVLLQGTQCSVNDA